MKSASLLRVRRTPFDRIPFLYDVAMWLASMFGPWALKRAIGEIPEGRVLDVGGGTGLRTAKYLCPGRGAVIADLSGPMLERALNIHGFHAVLSRGEELPFADGTFDAVFLVDTLHHTSDPMGCAKDAARVLAPGGRLFILDFEATTLAGKFVLLIEWILGFKSRFLTAERYSTVLRDAGADVEIRWIKSFEYLITGHKPHP